MASKKFLKDAHDSQNRLDWNVFAKKKV
jgi:hypothetical protein